MDLNILMPDKNVITMGIEEYLRGVVPSEVGARNHEEVLKAQSILARSFAVVAYKRPRHKGKDAHLCTEVHCQAYRERKIHDRTDKAIADTNGLIVTYYGAPAQTFYSAKCGGRTRHAWNPRAAPWCEPRVCPCMARGRNVYGHGVGACQIGMYVWAELGANYEDMIHAYFNDVEIAHIDSLDIRNGLI